MANSIKLRGANEIIAQGGLGGFDGLFGGGFGFSLAFFIIIFVFFIIIISFSFAFGGGW